MGDSEQPKYPKFESYDIRVASYATWTQYYQFDIDALAQAGLHNNGDGTTDVIQLRCFYCGKEFNNMSPEDDFLFQHFKLSRNCHYLRQKLGTNRIKEYEEKIQRENLNQQQVQASRSPGEWTALDRIRSPQYATLSARLGTFARWPPDMTQTPDQLANAGFYYTGLQDVVRSFACDGGFRNWDPDDDPWIEHARWFPQCPFVKRVKGQNFIDLVQRMAEESDEDEDADSDMDNSLMATDLNREEGKDCDPLTTAAARSVIEFGYNANIVAAVINNLRSKGHAAPTAAQILEVILDMEERGETKCDENASSSPLPSNTSRLQCSDQSSVEETQPLQQRMRCASCGRIEILFLPCNYHSTVRNCAGCKFICSYCSRTVRDSDT